MGREKEYLQRLKYQVASAKKKTLENQVAAELKSSAPREIKDHSATLPPFIKWRPTLSCYEDVRSYM